MVGWAGVYHLGSNVAVTRAAVCATRTVEQKHLALARSALSAVCGCPNCHDGSKADGLRKEIRISEDKITRLTNDIIDWTGVCA